MDTRERLKVVVASLLACGVGAVSLSPVAQDLKAIQQVPSLTLEAAVVSAQAALAECRKRGATVAVAVVDRSGVTLAVVRDPLAGMHTPDTAVRKAWTAVSFRGGTTELAAATAPGGPNGGIRHLPNVAMIGGGIPLEAAGRLVGAIGVSGAPNGDLDDVCAKAGIAAIRDALDLS